MITCKYEKRSELLDEELEKAQAKMIRKKSLVGGS
jgi:hypothetical protein